MPIWVGNLSLAKARAIENQIYLVSSTYSDISRKGDGLRRLGIRKAPLLVKNSADWGKVLVTEVGP